jgi:integrase
MMLSAGEPLAWVSHQPGHADTAITTRNYARWIPGSLPEAGDKAGEMFSGKRIRQNTQVGNTLTYKS